EDDGNALGLRLARAQHARGAPRGDAADLLGALKGGERPARVAPGGGLQLPVRFGDRRAVHIGVRGARLSARALAGGDGRLREEVGRGGGLGLAYARIRGLARLYR